LTALEQPNCARHSNSFGFKINDKKSATNFCGARVVGIRAGAAAYRASFTEAADRTFDAWMKQAFSPDDAI